MDTRTQIILSQQFIAISSTEIHVYSLVVVALCLPMNLVLQIKQTFPSIIQVEELVGAKYRYFEGLEPSNSEMNDAEIRELSFVILYAIHAYLL